MHAVVSHMKQIAPGSHVLGKFGDFLPSNDDKHQKQARMCGNVLEAIAMNKYQVLFDNSTTLECNSNSLLVEAASSSLPPDIPSPPTQDHSNKPLEVQCQEEAQQQIEADIQEQDEEEHLPTMTPKAEEEVDSMNEDV